MICMAGMTPEEEKKFIAESTIEASQMDVDALVNNEVALKLLAQPESSDFGIYKFGETEIRYKPFLTSKLRSILKAAERKSKMPDADRLSLQDQVIYDGLAEICMDPALKKPAVWAAIDIRSNDGRVYKIFRDILEKIGGGDTTIKSFR